MVYPIFSLSCLLGALLLAWIVQLFNLWCDMWYEHRMGVQLKRAWMTMKVLRSQNGNQ